MTKFILKIGCLVGIVAMTVVLLHAWRIMSVRSALEVVYSISDKQDVLFIGSSQVGCSIIEGEKFHNKKVWVENTFFQAFVMRLRELERRGQLANVKTLFLPFNFITLDRQTEWHWLHAYYQELPVSYRYLNDLPVPMYKFIGYIASNLRWPIPLKPLPLKNLKKETTPAIAISDRPEIWKVKYGGAFRSQHRPEFREIDERNFNGWGDSLRNSILQAKEICCRHNIRFVMVEMPVLPEFEERVKSSVKEETAKWVKWIGEQGIEYIHNPSIYGEDMFLDRCHMVGRGAVRFMHDLYKRANIPVL